MVRDARGGKKILISRGKRGTGDARVIRESDGWAGWDLDHRPELDSEVALSVQLAGLERLRAAARGAGFGRGKVSAGEWREGESGKG